MLDKLFIKNNTLKDVFTGEYTPEQAITNRNFVNEDGKSLHILFPPWHGGGKPYEQLIKRLANKGDAVLAYYFHDEILKPDTKIVKASYAYLRDTVSAELEEIVSSHDYQKVRLVAMSLGNPALSTVIGKFRDFDSASLVCSASSLARSMWYGARTQHIRAVIEQSGQDLAYLEEAWSDIAPINHIDALVGKNVSILVSTTDEIIPTSYQQEFVDAMQSHGISPNVQTTRLGHYASIGRYCLYDKI